MTAERIRESVIAGTWYPGSPDRLKREIQGYLGRVQKAPGKGNLIGLIAPHAGYMYSGAVAAHAYKLLEGESFDHVIVLAPSHRSHFQGASIYLHGGYRTPLGVVPLDRELVDALMAKEPTIKYVAQAHAQEHSLEIQLPFLQVVLGDFKLTPIVMGDQSFSFCEQLAESLASVCANERSLIVASSDLSHYHAYTEAKRLDDVVVERVAAFDPEGLSSELQKGACEACGSGPMVAMLLAARRLGANKAKVLRYANSGDVTGDHRGVVGYMAAAVYDNPGSAKSASRLSGVGVDLGLSEEEKATLKRLASETIRARVENTKKPSLEQVSEKLKMPMGAFVSLHKKGSLRGCIGSIVGRGPLYKTIEDMAIQAAFCDPRFDPLSADELDDLDLEISVLTPLERVEEPEQIVVGKHGLYIRKGSMCGLLLPQVATDNGWDREQFLAWTCRKACLEESAWQDPDTEIYIFSADIF